MRTKPASLIASSAIAEPINEVNMTPLIDVMLVLIIMLIITIPMQQHATTLTLPQRGHTALVERDVVRIDVDFDGTILWNGEVILNRKELSARLADVARSALPSEVHVRPSKLAPYKTVAGVLSAAQRSGVLHLGVVGNEQFM